MRARKKQTAQGPVEGKWDLPAGWEWRRLGEVATTSSGGTPSRKSPEFFKGTIPWVKSGELNDAVVSEVEEHITQQALSSSSAKVFPKGTLCIALYGATVGKLGFLGVDAATNQAVCAIFSQRFYNRFLFYYLLMQRQSLIDLGQGGAQPNISQTILGEFSTPLPPTLQDQERIVERIDSLFAELDKAEETLRHTITLCEQYKQSVLKAAVTGELSKEWRKANPPTETGKQLLQRILKERRTAWEKAELAKMTAKGQKPANDNWKKKYKEPQAPDTSGLPELPEGWTWATFPQLGEFGRGKSKHRPRDDARLYGGDYPFLQTGTVRASNGMITTYDNTYSDFGLAQSKLWPKGTVCITIAANIANSGILTFSACFPDSIVGLVPHSDINVHYIECFIRTAQKNLDRYAPATAQKNINLEILESVAIPMPPKDEQFFLAKLLEQHLEDVNGTKELCQKERLRCAALRQSILKQAFTGQLT